MNIAGFESLIRHVYKMGVTRGHYIPLLAWGESGVGKSQTVKRIARELEIDFIDLRLGQQEVADLIGLPRDVEVEINGEMVAKTVNARPEWFPEPGTKGILFLDEINRGTLEVRQSIFQLLLDRCMHMAKLPAEWIIISAVNPATEHYDTNLIEDRAFLARFMHIEFRPDVEEWLRYASDREFPPTIRMLVAEDHHMLGNLHSTLPRIVPTPRTWEMLALLQPSLPASLHEEVAAGLVGVEAAAAWLSLERSPERPVRGHQVLKGYDGDVRKTVQKHLKASRADLVRITLEDLASIATERVLESEEFDRVVACLLDVGEGRGDLLFGMLKFRFIQIPSLRSRISAHPVLYKLVKKITDGAMADE